MEENFVELQGTVEEIVFHNSDTGFTVLEIMTEDEYITVVGVLADVAPGEELRLRGNWVNHQTFGRQFRVEPSCHNTFALPRLQNYINILHPVLFRGSELKQLKKLLKDLAKKVLMCWKTTLKNSL